ncbi:MAG: PHP domain-containing protein, partial [Deltaproteobacteria bacterium]|nr:PHP domain-containing protein [Deltaproteobacteria bacterium]
MTFANLHVRSVYTILGGMIQIPDLIARTKELHMNAVALTDLGQMFGLWNFQKE